MNKNEKSKIIDKIENPDEGWQELFKLMNIGKIEVKKNDKPKDIR